MIVKLAIKRVYTNLRKPFIFLVPEARIELARTQGPEDFESSASTYFTTPALNRLYRQN